MVTHVCTCDKANQLVVALDPDSNVPLCFVARRLQCPLQKVMCVFESADGVECQFGVCQQFEISSTIGLKHMHDEGVQGIL